MNNASKTVRAVAALLRPRAIAVVGASAKEGSFGWRLVNSIRNSGFPGPIYPINPQYDVVAGLPCYPSLASISGVVDCVGMALSDRHLEEAMTAAAEKGVRGVVIFSRGYEPPTTPPPTLVDRWSAVAREAGIAVCGGNCMGFINYVDRLAVTGNPPNTPEAYRPTHLPGPIAVLSHSGSTWSGLNGNQRQQAYNYAVSVGREDVTRMADYLDFLLDQNEVRTIGLVMETIRDVERFIAQLERAERQSVPIVALKLGRTDQGSQFARSHSGAIAGSDAAFAALFERYNVSAPRSLDEFCDTLELMACERNPTTAAIGLGTDSGGERELIADIAADVGVDFAALSAGTRARLAEILDPGLDPVNPVDYWGDGRLYWEDCLKTLADDPAVGMVIMATNMVAGRQSLYHASECIENVRNYSSKPAVVMSNLHSSICRDEAKRLRGIGIPVLMGTQTGLAAVGHYLGYHRRRGRSPLTVPTHADRSVAERWEAKLAMAGPGALDIGIAAALLTDFGCPFVATEVVTSEGAAMAAAKRIGFPVVVKTATAGVLHKTDQGGVMLDVTNPGSVWRAYRQLSASFGPAVQVQAHAGEGVELFLGMVNDEILGPVVRVGLGGIFIEILRDVVTFIPPIGSGEARIVLERLKGFSLLVGARGSTPVDLDHLCEIICRFSVLCCEVGPLISEIDVNPVVVTSSGAVAVDVLVLSRNSPSKPSDAEEIG